MWEKSAYKVKFTVEGKPYCEVLIDSKKNLMVVPEHDPEPTSASKMFMGWDIPEGSYIGGADASPLVICGEDEEPIVCGDDEQPIVCEDGEIPEYDVENAAVVVVVENRTFNVVFKYMDESGQAAEKEIEVP